MTTLHISKQDINTILKNGSIIMTNPLNRNLPNHLLKLTKEECNKILTQKKLPITIHNKPFILQLIETN